MVKTAEGCTFQPHPCAACRWAPARGGASLQRQWTPWLPYTAPPLVGAGTLHARQHATLSITLAPHQGCQTAGGVESAKHKPCAASYCRLTRTGSCSAAVPHALSSPAGNDTSVLLHYRAAAGGRGGARNQVSTQRHPGAGGRSVGAAVGVGLGSGRQWPLQGGRRLGLRRRRCRGLRRWPGPVHRHRYAVNPPADADAGALQVMLQGLQSLCKLQLGRMGYVPSFWLLSAGRCWHPLHCAFHPQRLAAFSAPFQIHE